MFVSYKYKFIYVKNGKVAGILVESLFGKYCIDPKKTLIIGKLKMNILMTLVLKVLGELI